jgi:ornithine cyclodeaminase/alanine dehydrogenase
MDKHFSMQEAIAAMSIAFAGLSSGTNVVPERYVADAPDGALTLLLKPAFAGELNTFAVKMLTQRNSGPAGGIPTITGIVMLVDKVTGQLLSVMDGEHITALRTGAASGLATQLLARENSHCMALFGCGSQGRTQLEAVCAVRDIQKTWVFDTSMEQAESFLEEMNERVQSEIEIATDPSVLKEADIICTATPSEKPLFHQGDISDGTHINAIGSFKPYMQELDPDLIQSSRIYFDDRNECLKSGDIKRTISKHGDMAQRFTGEIGDLVLGKVPGRGSPNETTLFKSVGTAIQDLVVADHIYRKSRTERFGEEIRLYE